MPVLSVRGDRIREGDLVAVGTGRMVRVVSVEAPTECGVVRVRLADGSRKVAYDTATYRAERSDGFSAMGVEG